MDYCDLCDGAGESEFTKDGNRTVVVGCPACIQNELNEEITSLRHQLEWIARQIADQRNLSDGEVLSIIKHYPPIYKLIKSEKAS